MDWARILELPWTWRHVLAWFLGVIAACLLFGFPPWWRAMIGVAIGGVGFELLERYLERSHGVPEEHPFNRWVVDQICNLAGGALGWLVFAYVRQRLGVTP